MPHQPPPSYPCRILLGSLFGILKTGDVVEIRKSESMPELMGHHPDGIREALHLLDGSERVLDLDRAGGHRPIPGDVIRTQTERGNSGGRPYEEIPGGAPQIDEQEIHGSVVIAGVGYPIRPVVVEPSEVHRWIRIHLL